jgi:threonylcarbamoyladenosine tRNA methylthiotransferase MtaB
MNPDSAIRDFRKLLEEGYKEIILTGVNVGDYGKFYQTDLYHLLLRMIEVPGDFRIRISSIEPNLLSDNIIDLAASGEKLCRHFHIPLQSGNPEILRKMRRRYKIEDYKKLIEKLNSRIPDAGIGVDVIVGFPGETEEDFLTTYDFIRDLEVSYLHVFTYSERSGTAAVEMSGRVDIFERRRRNNVLRHLSERKKNLFYNKNVGHKVNVLFEAENHNGLMKGFSSNYIRVASSYDPGLINTISSVKISKVSDSICTGELTAINKSVDSLAS